MEETKKKTNPHKFNNKCWSGLNSKRERLKNNNYKRCKNNTKTSEVQKILKNKTKNLNPRIRILNNDDIEKFFKYEKFNRTKCKYEEILHIYDNFFTYKYKE